MNMKWPFFLRIILFALQSQAQEAVPPYIHAYPDLTANAGNQEVTAAFSYLRNFKQFYQFFFFDYNTQAIHQRAPDEAEVYRFRNGRICQTWTVV